MQSVQHWIKYSRKNYYYHQSIWALVSRIIPVDASVLEVGSKGGEILSRLRNKRKVGVESSTAFRQLAKRKNRNLKIVPSLGYISNRKFDYILLPHTFTSVPDVQNFIQELTKYCKPNTKIMVLYFNFLWKPFLDLGEKIGLKMPEETQPNWLSESDINNFFYLESYAKVRSARYFLFPFSLGGVSTFVNRVLSQLPLLNELPLVNCSIFMPTIPRGKKSVSIVIPARNEAGNIQGVLDKIPILGSKTEVIFVEGNSTDDTKQEIKKEIDRYRGPIKSSLWLQKGKGKGDAVQLGFSKAKNDLLMILDADLTVDPLELVKFYRSAIEGKGELIIGSRLVYPMEKLAMRYLNILGNRFFSMLFTFLLGQEIKDTLCGTKVILKDDYLRICKHRHVFGDFDPFGDYDLIFGAANLNLKIVQVPIRYKERTYGTTNISRFTHGLLLLKMTWFAAKKIKFV